MRTIIYPPFMRWDYMTQRPQQLMRQFSRLGYRVIFHSSQNEIPGGIKEVAPHLYVCNRNVTPTKHIRIDDPPILWITWPPNVKLVGKYYGEQRVVFDCVDAAAGEFAAWESGLPEILEKADLIFTASQPLYEKYQEDYAGKTYLCRNGVDYEYFVRPQRLPRELQKIKRPIIGYHGALAPWVDWLLIKELAEQNPEFSFVFVGPPYEMTRFPQAKNIYYLGYQDYSKLAEFIQGFDVGIIPFQRTEMTRSSCPIKMYEYLASGIPVVSTNLPEVQASDQVLIADDAEKFSLELVEALGHKSDDRKRARRAFASKNSWESRARFMLNHVERLFQSY